MVAVAQVCNPNPDPHSDLFVCTTKPFVLVMIFPWKAFLHIAANCADETFLVEVPRVFVVLTYDGQQQQRRKYAVTVDQILRAEGQTHFRICTEVPSEKSRFQEEHKAS